MHRRIRSRHISLIESAVCCFADVMLCYFKFRRSRGLNWSAWFTHVDTESTCFGRTNSAYLGAGCRSPPDDIGTKHYKLSNYLNQRRKRC